MAERDMNRDELITDQNDDDVTGIDEDELDDEEDIDEDEEEDEEEEE